MIAFGINKEIEKTKQIAREIETVDNILKILNECDDIETAKNIIQRYKNVLEFAYSMRPC